ncbi:hypothetical protein BSK56_32375 [Paenibacillus borealis]|uniref:Uncharacterized protein n=1 Tax=Paenibacillus borealis TaxID=160799 RepID=A0ABX3GVB6_PAEBO|nr:hypothetical protein BSK56_32375 [Paenibacillus borealis]
MGTPCNIQIIKKTAQPFTFITNDWTAAIIIDPVNLKHDFQFPPHAPDLHIIQGLGGFPARNRQLAPDGL